MQGEPVFLEKWLREQITVGTVVGPGDRPTPLSSQQPFTARRVLQSWTDLRNNRHIIDSLRTLVESQYTLHVADPQAKLLLSFLSSSSSSSSSASYVHKLLYIWVRKTPRVSLPLLDSCVQILSSSTNSCPDLILLLGAIATVPGLSEHSKRLCLDRLCYLIQDVGVAIGESPELVFAGIGYALSRSNAHYFTQILSLFFSIWSREHETKCTLRHGVMLLGLVEWLVMGFITSRSLDKIDVMCTSISVDKLRSGNYPMFALASSSAGVLRAFRRFGPTNRLELNPKSKYMIKDTISHVAHYVVSRVGDHYRLNDDDHECHLLVQCISLGLARCGPYPSDAAVLHCICLALLNDVFPLNLFLEIANSPEAVGRIKAKEYMDGVLFREAGAISGVLCNQYISAVTESMSIVEDFMWAFSHKFYTKFQTTLSLLKGNKKEIIVKEVEKMAESIFLMVVVFASAVAKRKLDEKSPDTMESKVAAKILFAFSCIEYLRRIRLPQYTDVVRRAVLILQENASTSTLFVDSMPSYDELTKGIVGLHSPEGLHYIWSEDVVQNARMLFYLRVIPTCIGHITSSVFRRKVAPVMFLYMCHPILKLSQASHSVFVAFISYGKVSNQNDDNIKEQLVFYYIQRSLEVYPELTPYKGMVAGVSALVQHLPAGSPAIFYCINSLFEKATSLFRLLAIKEDSYLWKNWEGDSEPCKKFLELLLHLITLVDIQVLPNMLKLLAQFIIKLPEEGQKIILDEIYSLVSESDDVTRKPTLVSWLHSLSYISSQPTSQNSWKETFSRL